MNAFRHHARSCAVQMLYTLSLAKTVQPLEKLMTDFWTHFSAPKEARDYADRLVHGVIHELEAVDAALSAASQHWRIERMAKIDLAVLRLGAYELLFEGDVPQEVVVDEAVELCKKFSTQESAAFVNGVLAPIVVQTKAER